MYEDFRHVAFNFMWCQDAFGSISGHKWLAHSLSPTLMQDKSLQRYFTQKRPDSYFFAENKIWIDQEYTNFCKKCKKIWKKLIVSITIRKRKPGRHTSGIDCVTTM